MTVVVHSFVADCSLLDCCDFVVVVVVVFLPTLGFWGGFSCFVSFIWCQLFACLIRAAIFRLPPAYVVWSFVLCHRQLWSVLSFFDTVICVHSLSFTAFSAVGIRVRLFVFALLALVSWYQCISQFLVSCCALADRQLHPWRSELDFFSKSFTLWKALQIPLWSKPQLVFRHKVYEIALSEVLATQMGVTEAQHQSACLILYKSDPFSPHSADRFRGNSCIVLLWVACVL